MDIKSAIGRFIQCLIQIFTFHFLLVTDLHASKVLAAFTSSIGGGNYTYYSLTETGDITIFLLSLKGDADLYVSDHPQPTSFNYQLSSASYGPDILLIPKDMSRPCGVGVYGHIHKPVSRYRLVAVLNYTGEYDDILHNPASTSSLFARVGEGKNGNVSDGKDGEGGGFLSSVMWQFLELIVKILAEILL